MRETQRAWPAWLLALLCGWPCDSLFAQVPTPAPGYGVAAPGYGAAAPRGRIINRAPADQGGWRFAQQPGPALDGPRMAPGGVENVPTPPPAPGAGQGPGELLEPDQVRLNTLDSAQTPTGMTPHPSPQTIKKFDQFIDRTIDAQVSFDLVLGRPRLLMLKQAPTRVQMGDENVANYTLITDQELSISGVAIGSTVLNLWFADPNAAGGVRILSYLVRVLPDPEAKGRLEAIYKALEAEINKNFPNSFVQLSLVGDKVLIRGEAKDIVEMSQIMQVVSANAPGQQRQGQQQGGAGGGRGGAGGFNLQNIPYDISAQNQNMMGTPQQFAEAQQLSGIASVANQVLYANSRVINLMRVPGEQQVMLRVTVAEVNRNATRSIGMNLNAFPNTANTMTSVSGGAASSSNAFPYVFQQLAGGIATGNLPVLLDSGQISLAINALRTLGLARSLAEPNMVTSNGQMASFHVGSNFPVPAAVATFGAVGQGVSFIPVGVSLFFIPSITDHDRVRLMVSAQVSSIDTALDATIGGATVPGTDARTFFTTVELREGQTLAIAGLIQNNLSATRSTRVPLFGDLPLLGTIFGSRSTSAQEQELVVLVTPELVHPLDACHTPPIPGNDIFEPGDVEFFLFGRLESTRRQDFRSGTRTDWDRMRVYERCEQQLIIGPQGRTYGCCSMGAVPGAGGNCPACGPEGGPPLAANQAAAALRATAANQAAAAGAVAPPGAVASQAAAAPPANAAPQVTAGADTSRSTAPLQPITPAPATARANPANSQMQAPR